MSAYLLSQAAQILTPTPGLAQPHVIVVGNQKGGAGKSTVAMHLIVALLRMRRRVGAIDLDLRQRTLTRYIDNRARFGEGRAETLQMPQVADIQASGLRQLDDAESADHNAFVVALRRLSETCEFVVIDAPGGDSFLSRLAHAHADTLITPLNDSFIDFDLLGDIDDSAPDSVRPSIYSEMVWESRKRRAAASRRPIDWIVLRNRTSASKIEARNKQRVGEALRTLSTRIGFRLAPGLSERVIYRELFPQGRTLLDLLNQNGEDEVSISHLAARQELRDLFITLKLPGFEGETLRF
jgi:chromosome partitioning protein